MSEPSLSEPAGIGSTPVRLVRRPTKVIVERFAQKVKVVLNEVPQPQDLLLAPLNAPRLPRGEGLLQVLVNLVAEGCVERSLRHNAADGSPGVSRQWGYRPGE